MGRGRGRYQQIEDSVCDEDFAEFVSVGCEVHETPDDVEFGFLVTLPSLACLEFVDHQGYGSGSDDCLCLFQGSRRDVYKNPARIILQHY